MLSAILSSPLAQLKGTTLDGHPELLVHECTKAGGCVAARKSVVMDANWRWIHANGTYENCYDSNKWDPALCPDPATCAKNCAIEGIDEESYEEVYGVSTDGESLRLNFVMPGNVGSRLYLLENKTHYELFKLKNAEITFDVDVSTLPCGVNGAVYFVQMDGDGGSSRFPSNTAGAAYGTGYCDAQCPHDAKFINGEPNILDWGPVPGYPDSGIGKYGSCCVEMDLWEANSMATAYTAHSCAAKQQTRCETALECGDGDARYEGLCDKDGCDLQTYRLNQSSFYGPGNWYTLDTTKPFTLVTQFITADGTDTGPLTEIRRHYKQNGVTIPSPTVYLGGKSYDSITSDFCDAAHDAFSSQDTFQKQGGMQSMGDSLDDGMVLVLSLWDDAISHMLWLDSTDPPNSTLPGAARGPCSTDSGDPKNIEPGSKAYAIYSSLSDWYKGCSPSVATTTSREAVAAALEVEATPSDESSESEEASEEAAASGSGSGWKMPRFATYTRRSKVAIGV